jgi:hypothetical protein
MDRVAELTTIVQREVEDYAGPAYKAKTYYIEDPKRLIYTVIIVPDDNYPLNLKAGVTVMARIIGSLVVIDQDITDRPLYEALIEAGIPRQQIVLAYTGELLPSDSDSK